MYISRSILLVSFVVVLFNLFAVKSAVAVEIFNSGQPNNLQWRNSDFSNQFEGEAADDFILSSDNQVAHIRWYGSYLFTDEQPMPDDFTINFYNDDTDNPVTEPSHTANFTNSVSRILTEVVVYTDNGDFKMYEYEVDISPIALQGNTRYWLSIVNNTQEQSSYGGWAWAYNTESNTHRWRRFQGVWETYGSGNLAFSLHSNEVQVQIDVKPGSDPNCFNINGHGVIPVAILGSASFDVSTIDSNSLSFGGLTVRVRGNRLPSCGLEDSNDDGFTDLVCQFEDDPLNWDQGNDSTVLIGSLFDGTAFEGSDSICIVP